MIWYDELLQKNINQGVHVKILQCIWMVYFRTVATWKEKWAIIFAVSVLTLTQDHLMKKDFKSAWTDFLS